MVPCSEGIASVNNGSRRSCSLRSESDFSILLFAAQTIGYFSSVELIYRRRRVIGILSHRETR